MNQPDEDIQRRVEAGSTGQSRDDVVYRKIFRALSRDTYALPSDFAGKVSGKVAAGSLVREYVWFAIGLMSIVTAAVAAVVMVGPDFSLGRFRFISSYWLLFVFGILFILMLNYLDRQLVRRRSAL